jgi:hypothetical protein
VILSSLVEYVIRDDGAPRSRVVDAIAIVLQALSPFSLGMGSAAKTTATRFLDKMPKQSSIHFECSIKHVCNLWASQFVLTERYRSTDLPQRFATPHRHCVIIAGVA